MTFQILCILSFFLIIASGMYWLFLKNKKNRKTARLSMKRLVTYNAVILLIITIVVLAKMIFPLKKDYGIHYNTTREKLGIPIIENTWHIGINQDFLKEYMAPSGSLHFKKRIGYNLLGAQYEIDYYLNLRYINTYAYSKYTYSNHEFHYYIDNPDGVITMKIYKGQFKFKDAIKTQEISKIEFEYFVSQKRATDFKNPLR